MKQDVLDLQSATIGYYMVHGARLPGRSTRRQRQLDLVTSDLVLTMGPRTMRRVIRGYLLEVSGPMRITATLQIDHDYVNKIVDAAIMYIAHMMQSSIEYTLSNPHTDFTKSRLIRNMARFTNLMTIYKKSGSLHRMVSDLLIKRQNKMKELQK